METDAQWKALRSVLGQPAWAMDPQLETLAGRQAMAERVDHELGSFTVTHEARALMNLLQAAGVPAGMVQRSSDLLEDPQLLHRRFFRPLEHPEMGLVPYEGHQYRIDGYDNGPITPAPCLGQHTYEVLTEVLGLNDDQVGEVLASGACG